MEHSTVQRRVSQTSGVGHGDLERNADARPRAESPKGLSKKPDKHLQYQPAEIRNIQFLANIGTTRMSTDSDAHIPSFSHEAKERRIQPEDTVYPKEEILENKKLSKYHRSASVKSNAAYCSEELDEPEVVDLSVAVNEHDRALSEATSSRNLFRIASDQFSHTTEPPSTIRMGDKEKTGLKKYWKQFKDSLHRLRNHESKDDHHDLEQKKTR